MLNQESAFSREDFQTLLDDALAVLFERAAAGDRLGYLMAILGLNSGAEDAGWQPIEETKAVARDLIGFMGGPIEPHSRARLVLLLYCHLIEANYVYHCLYNLLGVIEGIPPKIWSFLDLHVGGKPPSTAAKIKALCIRSEKLGLEGLAKALSHINRQDIRNAVFHSDYILFGSELRLKHRGSQFKKIDLREVSELAEKTHDFFFGTLQALVEARKSFGPEWKIERRVGRHGQALAGFTVLHDEKSGQAIGFSSSDPLPWWDE